jgi:hypothetical protein
MGASDDRILHIGKYRVNGTINDQNLVERTDTWFPNPFTATWITDALHEVQNFDGVQFPTCCMCIRAIQIEPAHNYYEYNLTDVRPTCRWPRYPSLR